MSTFAQYLAVVLLHEAEQLEDESYSGSFTSVASKVTTLLQGVKVSKNEVAEAISILVEFSGVQRYENPLTGGYFKVNYDNFRYYFIQDGPDPSDADKDGWKRLRTLLFEKYPILVTYAEIGRNFATDIIEHLRRVPESEWGHLRSDQASTAIPASDRIVSLSHNQVAELENPLSEVIDAVEKTNGDPDSPGFRERVLGQLRAGRELIRAGTIKSYLLYTVLLSALAEVAARNKGTAIEATINTLVELLINHVFSGG
ncbi:hypothetical protein GGQ88_001708 [Novosphingobium hassiacum]|uniref:Uncharacterized protein n=1 Tax=Novosphingobium hassiacum TaxID=173676 RepID=A0A7W5ZW28_9SPHN|nr:hypothetical protein [Novosphingobium hassiacum]MBB3860442.1 hypothetical protein [Novosphingobium hassiacum]